MITALWLLACGGTEPTATPAEPVAENPIAAVERGLALIYSHDLDGEIEPCG